MAVCAAAAAAAQVVRVDFFPGGAPSSFIHSPGACCPLSKFVSLCEFVCVCVGG